MNLPLPADLLQPTMAFLFVLFRVAAMVAMVPALGEQSIPARVKLAIAVCMSLIVLPAVQGTTSFSNSGSMHALHLVPNELAVGLVLGLMLRVFLIALQIAGSIAAQSTSLAQILGNTGSEPMPAIGHVLTLAGMTLAMILGLHVAVVSYVINSYVWMPLGEWLDMSSMTDLFVTQVASAFRLAFAIAAPFYLLAILYNLTLGVINRAMPQLMVAFVGAPFITGAALVMLAVATPFMLTVWMQAFIGFITSQEAW